jgi:hypothetical protein
LPKAGFALVVAVTAVVAAVEAPNWKAGDAALAPNENKGVVVVAGVAAAVAPKVKVAALGGPLAAAAPN